MASIAINVIDANHISLVLTARAPVAVTLDRGVSGVGIASISGTTISGSYYLVVTYTNGTTQNVGPFAMTGTVAAGANTQIQYNSSGALAGSANLTWNGTALGVGGAVNAATGLNVTGAGGFINSSNKFGVDNNAGATRMYASGPNSLTRGTFEFHTTDSVGTLDTIQATLSSTGLAVTGALSATGNVSTSGAAAWIGASSGASYQPNDGVVGGSIRNSGGFYITTSATERMRITAGGLVGIGTTSPDEQLSVAGNIRLIGNRGIIFQQSTGVAVGNILFRNGAGVIKAAIGSYYNVADEGALEFIGPTGSTNMMLNSSGNLGLGVTPSAWNTYKVLQVGNAATASLTTGNNSAWTSNAYFASGWSYVGTSTATQYAQLNGAHQWYSAPSGTAGTAITFTQAMVLNASGNLGLATTTSSARFAVASTTSTGVATSAWSNAYSIFGPNVGSTSGAALALGYNTSTDASEILSLAPGLAWKPMNVLTAGVQFNAQAGSEAMRITSNDAGAGTISMALRLAANNTSADNSIVAIGFGVQNDGFSKGGIGWLRGTGGSDTGNLTFYNNGTNDASNISTSNETMRIDTNKNLLIGLTTTAATTVKLQVSTDALINGLTIGRGGASLNASTAIGIAALPVNTTGQYNAAIGYRTLYLNTTGGFNTATGAQSLRTNLSGTDNVATGYSSLYLNSSGNNNSAFGSQALYNNTASNNTAVGHQAGYANTTGAGNVYVGRAVGQASNGSSNTAVGGSSGGSNLPPFYSNTSGTNNAAFGGAAMALNTTGSFNTAVGDQALYSNTTPNSNTGIGYQAAYTNTTGASNVAVGTNALYSNTTASYNTAVGYQAGYTNITGTQNAYFGYQAGNLATGSWNAFLGYQAGAAITTGYQSTFVGRFAGSAVTTGNSNVIIGAYTGSAAPISATGSNFVVLSDGDGNVRQYFAGADATFNGAIQVGTGNVLLYGNANPAVGIAIINTSTAPNIRMSHASGTGSGSAYMEFNYNSSGCGNITQQGTSAVLFTSISDYRAKTNQAPLSGSGAFIDALKPKTWDWASGDGKGTGFIAHEFQEVCPTSVTGEKDAVDEDGEPVYQSMQASSAEMIANLVAEIQDLRKRLATLEAK